MGVASEMATPNFENRTLYHGDNLDFLRGMNSETVDLIATDPPFNKNKDFHATPDSLARGAKFVDRWRWDEDVHPEWVDQIEDDWPGVNAVVNSARIANGDDMAAFLCWLGVRVIEMRRILKPSGSLYLHIDHTAYAWTKALMDAIFGRRQFQNTIVWKRQSAHSDAKFFGSIADTILFYGSSPIHADAIRVPLTEEQKSKYSYEDAFGRYVVGDVSAKGLSGGGYTYDFHGHPGPWRYPKHRLLQLEDEGRIHLPKKKGGVPRLKRYLHEHKGVVPGNIWLDIPPVQSHAQERTGYPTQKPLALYERIIKASSNEGDMVLDPFCGCATTPIAAEKLGRHWVGMDIWEGAHEIVLQRLASEGLAIPHGGGGRVWKAHVAYSPLGMSTIAQSRRFAPTKSPNLYRTSSSKCKRQSSRGRNSPTPKYAPCWNRRKDNTATS